MVDGVSYSPIYVYAGTDRHNVYRVPFSYVGTNKGNYILLQSVANGKVYQWVAPVNGIPQGDYEPVVQLNTPKMNELMALHATYAISDKLTAMTETGTIHLQLETEGNINGRFAKENRMEPAVV